MRNFQNFLINNESFKTYLQFSWIHQRGDPWQWDLLRDHSYLSVLLEVYICYLAAVAPAPIFELIFYLALLS